MIPVGKPVGVLGNQGACVIAKSYEMKAAGVRTGEPIWEASSSAPDGRLRQARLPLVRGPDPHDARRRPRVLAAGRVLLDRRVLLRGRAAGRTILAADAEVIRDRIWEAVRVPVTVGIARTRTLAKLISDAAKPFGALAVLDPDGAGAAGAAAGDGRLRHRRGPGRPAGGSRHDDGSNTQPNQ